MTTITLTPELEAIMSSLKLNYKNLSDDQILKIALKKLDFDMLQKKETSESSLKNLKYEYNTETDTHTFYSNQRTSAAKARFATPRFRRKKD